MKSYPIHIPYLQEPWPEFFVANYDSVNSQTHPNYRITSIAPTEIITDKYPRTEYTLTTFGNGFVTRKHKEFVFGWN